MKIGIHHTKGSFSERWIDYCKDHGIQYKIVDGFSNSIISNLSDCDAFLWHHNHSTYKDVLAAKRILFSLEQSGKIVFPNYNSNWHFDDKVGQKYLLESINAPLIPSYVFYSREKAIEWIEKANFPKVFKLKGGSGSQNVLLIKNKKRAKSLVNRAFGRGISTKNTANLLRQRLWQIKRDRSKKAIISFFKGLGRTLIPTTYERMNGKEKGYVYFQDFIPNNSFDTRLIVVGNRCFGIRRYNRPNDFRASGSGLLKYDRKYFDENCVKIAFDTASKIKSQSLAFDFVQDINGNWLIVEISYGYSIDAYDKCTGFWDRNLEWHDKAVNPQHFIIEDISTALKARFDNRA